MRREQIFKICLNIFLTHEVELKPKDDNSWTFAAADFSEGEFEPTSFAIRFKSKEIAQDFKKAVDDALLSAGEKQDGEADEKSQLVKRLMLPEKFFDYLNAPDCAGCVGCNPDDYVFSWIKKSEVTADVTPLPQEPPALKAKPKARRQSVDKHVSFKLANDKNESENEKLKQLFGTGNVQEKASVFEGGIKKSEGSSNIFASFNAENPPQATIFGSPSLPSSVFGEKTSPVSTSIFSSSLNTTPRATNTDTSASFGIKPSEPFGGLFGNKTSFSFGKEPVFGSSKENGDAANNALGVFSATPAFGNSVFGTAAKPDSTLTTTTPAFGNSVFGVAATAAKPDSTTSIFGSGQKTFSFAEAAKDLSKPIDYSASQQVVPDFLQKSNGAGGFAALAASSTPEKGWTTANNSTSNANGGFIGLTVKNDFFSKNFNKQNSDAANTSQDDDHVPNDDSHDPHFDPIIDLPDEINVSTGEEEEEKLFGERAKLFRYDTKTKEWKERGELKKLILQHEDYLFDLFSY